MSETMNDAVGKIVILGNSVPLLMDPPRKEKGEKTYGERLEDMGFRVFNRAKQAVVVSDLYRYMEDECTRLFPDIVVLNFGIVECTTRVRSRRMHSYFSENAWKNSIIDVGYVNTLGRIERRIGKKIFRIGEKALFALGFRRRWVSAKDFEFIIKDVIRVLFRDTNTRCVCLVPILNGAPWLEREAPGTLEAIGVYNSAMRRISSELEGVRFLEPSSIYRGDEEKDISGDGIHLSAHGHARVADEIAQCIRTTDRSSPSWKSINVYGKLVGKYANRH